jgi:hypothetical protein
VNSLLDGPVPNSMSIMQRPYSSRIATATTAAMTLASAITSTSRSRLRRARAYSDVIRQLAARAAASPSQGQNPVA